MRYRLAAAATVAAAASLSAHDPITTRVTWEREIATIVQARCVSCHAPGGPAPMALTTYAETRPWVRAMREEVLARRMPKWPVVRGYGDFTNDPSLSSFEIALITAWADGGAPATSKPSPGRSPVVPPAAATLTAPTRPTAASTGAPPIVRPCTSQPLPRGRLVAVKLMMAAGASLKLIVRSADGLEEPLIWVRDFDPAFAEAYWLRNPMQIRQRARLLVTPAAASSPACSIALTFAR